MSLSISDIASGISWTEKGKLFYINKGDNNSIIIIEYLNDASMENLTDDSLILNAFQVLLTENNKQKIETYIINELNGFTEYGDGEIIHHLT